MDTLIQDIRYALRTLRRSPGFTLAAVATLALGIGANTAIFSVVSAVLLRPLPYPDADRITLLWGRRGTERRLLGAIADMDDFRTQGKAFSDVGVVRSQSVNITGGDAPDRLVGAYISANVLDILGAQPAKGRLFRPEETALGTAQDVAVLSYAAWSGRFGGDPAIIGKSLTLDGRPRVVIGVTEEGFNDPFAAADVWLPIGGQPANWFTRGVPNVWAFGKMKPGVTVAQAQRDVSTIAARIATANPQTNAGVDAVVVPLREQVVGSTQPVLLTLLVFVGVVLLIACANVANLQMARAESRRRELAVRAALGAGRGRLVRQLLSESLVLAGLGGGLGLFLAVWATRALVALVPGGVPAFGAVGMDPGVIVFCASVTIATGLAFGAVPAFRSSRTDLKSALSLRPGQSHAKRAFDVRDVLITGQLALCIVLLVGAGLLSRSLIAMQRVDVGFEPANLLTAEFRLPPAKYDTRAKINRFLDDVLVAVRQVPGVRSAAWVRSVPLTGNFGRQGYGVVGQPRPAVPPEAQQNAVSPAFFATFGIRVLEGRDFDSHDRDGAPLVVAVNEELARRAWPGQSAIGKQLTLLGPPDTAATVVAVVHDIKQLTLGDAPTPQIYQPVAQAAVLYNSIAIRTSGNPLASGSAVRAAIWSVDKDQPVWRIRAMDAGLGAQVAQPRFTLILTGAFALLALALACVGVYGVMSYLLVQRTREVGIRVALGARPDQVVRAALGHGVRVVGIATVLGVIAASASTRLLQAQQQLFGVGAFDPLTFIVVPVLLATVALAACWFPARRAARVDPMVALRGE